jgi:hypothetical protein
MRRYFALIDEKSHPVAVFIQKYYEAGYSIAEDARINSL